MTAGHQPNINGILAIRRSYTTATHAVTNYNLDGIQE